jgi:hypothetical protein
MIHRVKRFSKPTVAVRRYLPDFVLLTLQRRIIAKRRRGNQLGQGGLTLERWTHSFALIVSRLGVIERNLSQVGLV